MTKLIELDCPAVETGVVDEVTTGGYNSRMTKVESLAQPAGAREVPVREAKAKLTELLRAVESGKRITLTRHGKPVADLVPHSVQRGEQPMSVLECAEAWHKANPSARVGWVSPHFDDPLPEDFLLQPLPEDFDDLLKVSNRREG
jgi:prevent-host-death family protein